MGFRDFAITSLIFNPVFAQSLDRGDDGDLQVQQHVSRISARNHGRSVCAADLARYLNVPADRAYAMLRKAVTAGTIFRENKPSKANLKLYLPAKSRPFLPDPADIFEQLSEKPRRVSFVHPLTGHWVVYGRTDE